MSGRIVIHHAELGRRALHLKIPFHRRLSCIDVLLRFPDSLCSDLLKGVELSTLFRVLDRAASHFRFPFPSAKQYPSCRHLTPETPLPLLTNKLSAVLALDFPLEKLIFKDVLD